MRTHQANDIAELRYEFLSLLELIACIGCAVAEQKPSEALGNTHTCVLPLPRRPYRRCGLFVCGSSPYRHSERSVGIQRSESKSSACVHSTLHQAIGRAKLRQDFLPVLDLRAYARLCGEIARASKVLSNKRTLVAFAYAPLEQ